MVSAVGSLVQARGGEWVVLPELTDDLLMLRPLGGADREIAGIYLPLEGADVRPAVFDCPIRPGPAITAPAGCCATRCVCHPLWTVLYSPGSNVNQHTSEYPPLDP